jgi:hypothetical protein
MKPSTRVLGKRLDGLVVVTHPYSVVIRSYSFIVWLLLVVINCGLMELYNLDVYNIARELSKIGWNIYKGMKMSTDFPPGGNL